MIRIVQTLSKTTRLHLVVGLPRAGKSTLCRTLGFPVVETDAIRKVLRCFPFDAKREPEVWELAHNMVAALFEAGHTDVILDSVSHTSESRNAWCIYERVFHEVRTSCAECCTRAEQRDQDYLIPVIQEMDRVLTWPSDAPMTLNSSGVAVQR